MSLAMRNEEQQSSALPSNVGVVQNNNGNQNTSGVRSHQREQRESQSEPQRIARQPE